MTNEMAIQLPNKTQALDVYTAECGLDPYLAIVRKEIDCFVPDISTKKGRDAVASMAFRVAKSKTALDALGKDLVAELKEKPKLIDAERKRMRDLLDQWKDEVRQPLTAWENAETARLAALESAIQQITDSATGDDANGVRLTAAELRERLHSVQSARMGDHWQEFEAQAARAKESAIEKLTVLIDAQDKAEAEQAELSRLRIEQAEREEQERLDRVRQEAIEQERKAAEQRAAAERARIDAEREAERKAAADAERNHQLAIERAAREKAEAEAAALREKEAAEQRQAAAVAAERSRIAQEQEHAQAEAQKKAANRAHRAQINNEALADLQQIGMSEQQAKDLIVSIASGSVRNITINY